MNHLLPRIATILLLSSTISFATESKTSWTSPARLRPYAQAGMSIYDDYLGKNEAFAYSIGAEYSICPYASLDLGYIDFGEMYNPHIPAMGLIDLFNDYGTTRQRRGAYILPTLAYEIGSRLRITAAIGPCIVDTRDCSYSYLLMADKVAAGVRDETHWEGLWKASLSYRITDTWSASLSGMGTKSLGYSTPSEGGGEMMRIRSIAIMAGVQYTPSVERIRTGDSPWTFDIGPAFTHLAFHETYRTSPRGYNLAIRRAFGRWFTMEIGHTEYGTSNERPTHADGGSMNTPPFHFGYENGDLQVKIGSTYALAGVDYPIGERWRVGVAAGPARTVATFMGQSPVWFLRWARYTDRVDKVVLLGQAHIDWKIGNGWHARVALRYTEFNGPQLAYVPKFEPPFGNTQVRAWTVMPQLSLHF